jgi:hypothetical protein
LLLLLLLLGSNVKPVLSLCLIWLARMSMLALLYCIAKV